MIQTFCDDKVMSLRRVDGELPENMKKHLALHKRSSWKNVLLGMGSLAQISPTIHPDVFYKAPFTRPEQESLAHDWEAVGMDMYKAIDEFKSKID